MNLTPQMFKTAQTVVRVAGILAITIFSARILSRVVRALTEREDVPLPSGSIFVNLTRGVVWVLGVLSILATLGVSIAPLVTALGVGGLAVGLALQPTLENVFSGIQLITSRQIQPGDFIRLDSGDEGTVLDVSWRNTTVRKVSNDVVIVPNSVLARAAVTNFSTADKEFVLLVPVSFASAGDPDAVQRIALDVARSVVADVPGAVKDQEPGAGFAELTPPAAVLNVTVRCNTYQDRIAVRHELIRRLAKRFADEGIAAPPVAYSSARRP
jgi:small-conductance mechanosensitive channel